MASYTEDTLDNFFKKELLVITLSLKKMMTKIMSFGWMKFVR